MSVTTCGGCRKNSVQCRYCTARVPKSEMAFHNLKNHPDVVECEDCGRFFRKGNARKHRRSRKCFAQVCGCDVEDAQLEHCRRGRQFDKAIWLHHSRKHKIPTEQYQEVELHIGEPIIAPCTENFFSPTVIHDLGTERKPNGDSWMKPLVWCGLGRWPSCPFSYQVSRKKECNPWKGKPYAALPTSPQGILVIWNLSEVSEFMDKYALSHDSIDWNRVRDDGYNGIAIMFDKPWNAPDGADMRKYPQAWEWHSNWDVTTCVIWDHVRAFGNRVQLVRPRVGKGFGS